MGLLCEPCIQLGPLYSVSTPVESYMYILPTDLLNGLSGHFGEPSRNQYAYLLHENVAYPPAYTVSTL